MLIMLGWTGALCTGEKGEGTMGKALWYQGSLFHRVIRKWVEEGSFEMKTGSDGRCVGSQIHDSRR